MRREKEKKKMKIVSSKSNDKSFAIGFILLLAASAVLPAFAKTYTAMPDRDTWTEVGVSPKLIGLGQSVLINILTYPGPSGPTYYAQDLASYLTAGFSNVSCTITKADGTKETFMPIDETLAQIGKKIPGQAQIVGSLQFPYKADQVGNWSGTASFPGQTSTPDLQYANMNLSVYYKPSSSTHATTFTVQQDEVLAGLLNGWPWSPLPATYWTNPVYANNREWSAISGAWVQTGYDIMGNNYNPYSTAPTSPHIVWANTISSAGLASGIWGSLAYTQAAGGAGTTVLDGKIYQNEPAGGIFDCIDLRTGQKLWSATGSIVGGQTMNPPYQTEAQLNEGGGS